MAGGGRRQHCSAMTSGNDKYPSAFTIAIDRERLRGYLRTGSLIAWTGVLAIFGALFGFATITKAIDSGELHSMRELIILIATHTLIGMGAGITVGLVCYLCLSHWQSALAARYIAVSVDGPFLCIQRGAFIRSDRKIHFRCIHDYTVIDHWLARRFGIQTLQMTVSGGGQHPFILIPGIKDALKTRDMLAEIDSQRENG